MFAHSIDAPAKRTKTIRRFLYGSKMRINKKSERRALIEVNGHTFIAFLLLILLTRESEFDLWNVYGRRSLTNKVWSKQIAAICCNRVFNHHYNLTVFFLICFLISASHMFSGNWNPNRIRQPRLRIRWASNAISKRSARGRGTKQYLIHFTLSPVAIYPNRTWPAWCQDRRPTQRMTQMVMYLVSTFIISTLCLYRRQRK